MTSFAHVLLLAELFNFFWSIFFIVNIHFWSLQHPKELICLQFIKIGQKQQKQNRGLADHSMFKNVKISKAIDLLMGMQMWFGLIAAVYFQESAKIAYYTDYCQKGEDKKIYK